MDTIPSCILLLPSELSFLLPKVNLFQFFKNQWVVNYSVLFIWMSLFLPHLSVMVQLGIEFYVEIHSPSDIWIFISLCCPIIAVEKSVVNLLFLCGFFTFFPVYFYSFFLCLWYSEVSLHCVWMCIYFYFLVWDSCAS